MDILLGITGNSIPYSVRSDDVMTLMLLMAFCAVAALMGYFRKFLGRQVRVFFYGRQTTTSGSETFEERYFILALCLNACLMMAFAVYFYATGDDATTKFSIRSHPLVVASFLAMFVLYFLAKTGIYSLVNITFFGSKKNLQWINAYLLLVVFEGLLLMPVVMAQFYGGLPLKFALFCYGFVLFLNKMLSFYKCFRIFSLTKDGFVQIFLYFCTLEIIPMLAFAGILQVAIDSLKINF